MLNKAGNDPVSLSRYRRVLAQLRIDLDVMLKQCLHAFYSSPAVSRVIGYHPPIDGGYADYASPPESVS